MNSAQSLEPHSRQFLQLLVKRIDFNTEGFQRRDAEKRLRLFVSEKYGAPNNFSHQFDSRDGNIHLYFTTIRQYIGSLGFRANADGFQVLLSVAPVSTKNCPSQRLFRSAGLLTITFTISVSISIRA